MNENGDFALVPRLSGAVEKTVPSTKRVLSGMVADTLALVRKNETAKCRIVILARFPDMRTIYTEILEMFFQASVVEFDDGDDAWQEMLRRLPDLLITQVNHPGLPCEEILHRLQERKASLSVLVVSNASEKFQELHGRSREWADLNVTFLPWPWTPSSLLGPLEAALKIKAR